MEEQLILFNYKVLDEWIEQQRQLYANLDEDQRAVFESGFQWTKKEFMKRCSNCEILEAMMLLPNTHELAFVCDNFFQLKQLGKYEEALLDAYTGTKSNYTNWSFDMIRFLFSNAKPEKLRAAGERS